MESSSSSCSSGRRGSTCIEAFAGGCSDRSTTQKPVALPRFSQPRVLGALLFLRDGLGRPEAVWVVVATHWSTPAETFEAAAALALSEMRPIRARRSV